MKFDPALRIQELHQFGEFGDVNPSITDSATYTFLHADDMQETFLGHMEGCFLYSIRCCRFPTFLHLLK